MFHRVVLIIDFDCTYECVAPFVVCAFHKHYTTSPKRHIIDAVQQHGVFLLCLFTDSIVRPQPKTLLRFYLCESQCSRNHMWERDMKGAIVRFIIVTAYFIYYCYFYFRSLKPTCSNMYLAYFKQRAGVRSSNQPFHCRKIRQSWNYVPFMCQFRTQNKDNNDVNRESLPK